MNAAQKEAGISTVVLTIQIAIIYHAGFLPRTVKMAQYQREKMLDRFVHKFINYLEIEKNASGHTVTNYKIDLREFSESIKDKPIEQVTHLDVRLFLAKMKEKNFSKRSVARKMACLRSFFKFLYREGYIKLNPAASLSTPKIDKKLPLFLSADDAVKLLESPDPRDDMGLRDMF